MSGDVRTGESKQAGARGSNKFRNWQATLNCGFTGMSCRLSVEGEYHLGMRCGGAKLERRTIDINPALFTIDVVQAEGEGGEWVHLGGEFEAGPEVQHVILVDWEGERYEFDVHRRDT